MGCKVTSVTAYTWGQYFLLPPANEVWGKVIFLHLFVILFTGGVCLSACWDTTTPLEQTPLQDQAPPQEQTSPRADTPWSRHPPGAEHAGRYGQWAGSTHPTGMQSCCQVWIPTLVVLQPSNDDKNNHLCIVWMGP